MDKHEILTYTGRWINPFDPDPVVISIEDIGHALSNQCRFTGHVRKFYSVAEHSCRVAGLLTSAENRLYGLLHDASEAYLSDIARPVKQGLGLGEAYREVEDNLNRTIAGRFGLEYPWPDEVHQADNVMLRTEQRDLMPEESYKRDHAYGLTDDAVTYGPRISDPLSPSSARAMFFRVWAELTGETDLADKYHNTEGSWTYKRGG